MIEVGIACSVLGYLAGLAAGCFLAGAAHTIKGDGLDPNGS